MLQNKVGRSTNDAGIPLVYKDSSLTIGKWGPIVLTDYNLLQQHQSFNRERIPERVVHAKGAGAFGYFEVCREFDLQECHSSHK